MRKKLIKLVNWITFDTWSDEYIKGYRKKLIHWNSTKILLICLQLTWEIFLLDTLLMSSETRENFKKEWSVYKKFQKRRYLFNSKSRDHIISKTKHSTSRVSSFQPLTSAVKSCIPNASDASWSTSALQILLHKHFLIYVNQVQHKKEEYIHSHRLILIKKKTNQTENCHLEVISASPGYVKFLRLLPLVQS